MAHSVRLKQPATGILKKGFYGFSWTTLFWGGFPAIFRGDMLLGLAVIVVDILTCCIGRIIWAFVYNKKYTLELLEKGYIFADTEEITESAMATLGVVEQKTIKE